MKALARHLSVLVLGVGLFFLQGPSLTRHLDSRLGDGGDALLNAWILAWDAHALFDPNLSVWDAPIFYPVKNTLTFSETMFGNLWVALPVHTLTGNPILAANLFTLAAFVLSLYGVFLVTYRLTGRWAAGVVAGVLFSFNPIRWGQLPHMNLLPFFWAPLALWCCHRFLETRRARPFFGVVLALAAQYYTSINLGTILLTTLLLFTGVYALAECRGRERFFVLTDRRVRRLLPVGLALGTLLLLPLAVPYARTLQHWDFVRTEADNVVFSCEPLSLVVPNGNFASYRGLAEAVGPRLRGHYGLGLAPWLLAGAGLVVAWRRREAFSEEQRRLARRLAWTALGLAVLMLGPKLIWFNRPLPVPMPYFLVYHVLPGAKGMRVPARFFLPLLLCLAVLAGYAVAYAAASWRRWRAPARILLSAAAVVWLAGDYAVTENAGFTPPPPGEFPPVYAYLARGEPGRPVLELPARWNGQFEYLYYQTAHWRPLVGGVTGSFTRGILETTLRTDVGPTDDALRFLELSPAMTVVLHLDRYASAEAAAWRDAPLERHGFRRAGEFGAAVVWERVGEPPATSPRLRLLGVEHRIEPRLGRSRLLLTAEVCPAAAGLPWRCLERGFIDADVIVTDTAGREVRYARRLALPPYLFAGERTALTTNPITGAPADVVRVQIRAPLLVGGDAE